MSATATEKTSAGSTVAVGGMAMAIVVGLIIYNGWILSILWNWFIPNIFPGVPSLTIGYAIAISIIVSALMPLRPGVKRQKSSDWESFYYTIIAPLLKGFLLLIMGYIVQAIIF
jgi:hypothetical protein